VWLAVLSDQLRIGALVGRDPTNQLIRRGALPRLPNVLSISRAAAMPPAVCGLSAGFPAVSPTAGQVPHVLLTRPPLGPKPASDLHVLGAPPAFVLSQDQTLQITLSSTAPEPSAGSPLFRSLSRPYCSNTVPFRPA
jgi:hypothetical protein